MGKNVVERLANAIEHSTTRVIDMVDRIPRRTKVMVSSGQVMTTQYIYFVSAPPLVPHYWLRKPNGMSAVVNNFVIL